MSKTGFPKSFLFYCVSLSILVTGIFYTCADVGVTNDDAYIFYRYANHFVELGELSYNPGEITYGYSSFLWVIILGVGALLTNMSPVIVAKCCLVLLLWASAVFVYLTLENTIKSSVLSALGMLIYSHDPFVTMHVYDGMGSGLLLCGFTALMWFFTTWRFKKPFLLGVLIGIAFLIRPEMILLIPALFITDVGQILLDPEKDYRSGLRRWVFIGLGAAIFVLPYVGYMKINTGSPIPQTYVGKVLTHNPKFFKSGMITRNMEAWKIKSRLIKNLYTRTSNVLLGVFLMVFLPLFVIPILAGLKRREILWIVPFYLFIVALFISHYFKFPTANWRYYMTVYPTVFMGLSTVLPGLAELNIIKLRQPLESDRIIQCVSLLALIGLVSLTYPAYSQHRSAHEFTKLSSVGMWLKENMPPDSVLAFDMIGAIGYVSEVEIFDLCGLIDPAMWPCQIDRGNTTVILDVFKKRGVTHIAQYEQHISVRPYIQSLNNHLKLIANLHIGPETTDVYKVYEILYDKDSQRKPVVTGLLQSNKE